MGKVTMQDIADALGTSRISVWKAFNNQPGVSKALIDQIFTKAEELGYSKVTSLQPQKDTVPSSRTVSVVVSRPESSIFWMQIIHQLAKELALNNINLMYTYLPTTYKDGEILPETLSNGSISGAIILNVYDEHFLKMLASLSIPKVFLDTVPTIPPCDLNGDLVMLSGSSAIKEITEHLLDCGKKNLTFIGDTEYAQSNYDRYCGFLDALKAKKITPQPNNYLTHHINLDSHYEEISDFLDSLQTMPDGIVCASDYIAHFVKEYLDAHNYRVPKDIMLTGFDNNIEYGNVANLITTVDVEIPTLGKRLARKIIFGLDFPGVSYEVSYIEGKILYRQSTDS